jgi:hypothetical protein
VTRPAKPPLAASTKLALAALTWTEYVRVVSGVRRMALPDLVRRLETNAHRFPLAPLDPVRLGKLVAKVLDRGPVRPRCLTLSLVFFRMLVRQGAKPQLVIGLPPSPSSHEAHAWVELSGVVVGPPPGRLGHEEMVRYGG